MAVYKVIQDVEAEDKVVGPLSIKQLVYASVAAGLVFLAFRVVTASGSIFFAIPFLPFILVLGALAAPLSRDQTTEVWLAAQIRFFTKPRKRLWDQDGMKELVHITVPKREEKHYTDGLDQTQVRSRLSALASTLDSRGWAVRHADLNTVGVPGISPTQSDRLIDPSSLPMAVSDNPVTAADDILDVQNNQIAQHFDEMMKQSDQKHKQMVKERMLEPATVTNTQAQQPPEDYYFMHESKPDQPVKKGQAMFDETVVQPGTQSTVAMAADDSDLTEEEKAAIEHAKEKQKTDEFANYNHHKVILTPAQLEEQAKANAARARQQAEEEARKKAEEKAKAQATHLKKADTIELVDSNLKVSTIAGLAKHKTKKSDTDEVVINLH